MQRQSKNGLWLLAHGALAVDLDKHGVLLLGRNSPNGLTIHLSKALKLQRCSTCQLKIGQTKYVCKLGSSSLTYIVSNRSKDKSCLFRKGGVMLALLFVPLSTRDDPIGSSNRAIKASNAPLHFFLNVGRDFRLEP